MTSEAERIAASLTKAQRGALANAQVLYPGCWMFRMGTARGTIPLGLGTRTVDGVALTPLGLEVRRILQGGQNG